MGIYIYTIPVIQYTHVHVEPYCCGFVSMIWAMWVSACSLIIGNVLKLHYICEFAIWYPSS